MSDIDALLKDLDFSKKTTKKDNPPIQQKLPMPHFSSLPKADYSDTRKPPMPPSNFSLPPEQRKPLVTKNMPKSTVEQSFDIDAILQGHSLQPHQHPSAKHSHPMAPAKNSASSTGKDSLTDWLNEDRTTTKLASNIFSQKVSTHASGKPPIDLNVDDFFSSTNNRDHSATKAPFSTTKPSAKQYYLGNSRYKPGNFENTNSPSIFSRLQE